MISYCCGNMKLLEFAEFSEINEIVEYLVNKENDETLLQAYQASYAALQNIPFGEFKKKVMEKAGLTAEKPVNVIKVHEKVENLLNNSRWKEA